MVGDRPSRILNRTFNVVLAHYRLAIFPKTLATCLFRGIGKAYIITAHRRQHSSTEMMICCMYYIVCTDVLVVKPVKGRYLVVLITDQQYDYSRARNVCCRYKVFKLRMSLHCVAVSKDFKK